MPCPALRLLPSASAAFACLLPLCLAAPASAWQGAPVRGATARTAQAAVPSREQRARQAAQDAQIVEAARQVLALVDQGRTAEVWEGASPAMKRAVPQAEFVRQLALDRRRLGAVVSRAEPVVGRERYAAGGRVPQGAYLNVAFATRFGASPGAIRELVSFRLDEDRVWRVSGYSVR